MPDVITKEFVRQIYPFNDFWADVVMSVLKLKKINRIYNELYPAEGLELIVRMFDYFNIKLDYDPDALSKIPESGPFISVSNHPMGFIDGFFLIWLITRRRSDLKLTANYLLRPVSAPLSNYFISVNPFDTKKRMGGSKKSLDHLNKGHALGLFPAGEVSTYYRGQRGIMDRPWGTSSMRLIKTANVPVVPIFFHGTNSSKFHLLGRIHPFIRTALLPSEFLNKTSRTLKAAIGNPIPPDAYSDFEKPEDLAENLRERVYRLRQD